MKTPAIIGTAMIDQVFKAKQELKFDQCNKGSMKLTVGGSMCNLARNCALLDFPITFYTKLGNDFFARWIEEALTTPQITLHAKRVEAASPVFAFLYDEAKNMKLSTISEDFLYQQMPAVHETLIVTDNAQILSAKNPHVIFSGSIPKAFVHGLLINREEAMQLDEDLEKAVEILKKQCDWVIVTCDKEGVIYDAHGLKRQPALVCEHGFSLGCGDAFAAGFLKAFCMGIDFDACVHYGQQVAAVKYRHEEVVCAAISEVQLSMK